jgi:hypothetical protein
MNSNIDLSSEKIVFIYIAETPTVTHEIIPMPTVPSAKKYHYTKGMTKREKRGLDVQCPQPPVSHSNAP